MTSLCHCGKPLHYNDPEIEKMANTIIALSGEYLEITSLETGKKYKVQKHYIMLHGVKGDRLDSYGFEEVA